MRRTWAAWAMAAIAVASLAAAAAPMTTHAGTVMVIEDFAPMRMIPSASSPRKAYAPLGLLLKTRRVSSRGDFIEGTNGETRAFEDPAWLHYWVRPGSILEEPGDTKISLDLVVHQHSGPPERSARADFPGRRYSVAQFLADSTALPDSYYVSANPHDDRSPWGGEAQLLPPTADRFDPPGLESRKKALRGETQLHLYVSLLGPKPIRSVRERLAVARVLVTTPGCGDLDYVETEVMTIVERTRKVGGPENTIPIAVPVKELTETDSAAEVQWSRLVYVATVTYDDGSAETIARRLFVTWPHCP
ncbi:MAG TPA: hypothetical protein VFU59_05920 [Candidatus Eisenbacteria bacterium]|nr:hypothetical protein [Candidatus Eisenbacteria bacterium]